MNTSTPKYLKQYIVIFMISVSTSLIFAHLGDERGALSVIIGGILATLVQYFSATFSKALLHKKSVAIAGGVIVFKYAIFGIIIWFISSHELLTPLGFMIGFLSLIPSLFLVGLVENQALRQRVRT